MNRIFKNFFASLPIGPKILLLVFALGFPLALVGLYTHTFDLYTWLGLSPALVWKGQLWRVFTYGLLAIGPADWAVNVFWLATLVTLVGRNWSSLEFWSYCLLAILAGAIFILVLKAGTTTLVVGSAPMVFALLCAWDWFYRNERILLLAIGELSVRQAVILVAVIESIILFFCCGWILLLASWCGGAAGWLYLTLRSKLVLGKTAQQIRSERVARLEL